jgi:hypothetical protein
LAKSINIVKAEVSSQLEKLSVHIPDDQNYETILQKLTDAQVDFTAVAEVNDMIARNSFPDKKQPKKNYLKPLYFLIILNSIIPYLLWRKISKKIDEIEFIDTFRFALNLLLFSLLYFVKAIILSIYFGNIIGFLYLSISAFIVLIYSSFAPANAKKHTILDEAS